MALTVQNLRAVGTGVEPASLLPGQICFNLTDKVLYVGDGSNFKTNFDGTQAPGVPGNGWYAMPMDFDTLGEYFVANPEYYGDIPTDQQVLTWSDALNHPIWTNGGGTGGNQVYVLTNAEVAVAPGTTTSDKITAAIGVASPDEGDVAIVTGLPDDVYEGLYFYASTVWVKGAAYAYPSATEVIYDNTAHPTLAPTVQGAIDDLDDGLAATTAIANTANSTANSALSIANAALPKAGGTMTGTIVARNINIQNGYTLEFAGGVNGIVTGISNAINSTSNTTAASSSAVNTTYLLAQAAIPRSSFTGSAELLVGTGPGTFLPLSPGTPGQILAVASSGSTLEWVDDSAGDVTSVTGVAPITVDNNNPQTPIVGIDLATTISTGVVQVGTNLDVAAGVISVADTSTTNKGVVQLNDTTNSTSVLQAATANAVNTTYQLADAAVPRSSYTADGDILVGTAPGTFGALGVGTEGQVLSVFGGVPAWVDDVPGDVTGVTGLAPIVVDNTDPENPIVTVTEATTADLGVVQIDITGNINVAAGVITVPNASTTVRGAVQLNNTLSSNSTTEALTAAQGAALQAQISTLNLTNSVILAGGYNAVTGLVDGVTAQGTAANFVDGAAPPVADATNVDHYLICTTAGTVPSAMENGDWLLSSETSPGVYAYVVLGVGARPATASYTQAGVVQLADGPAVLAGTSDATAITPQALQDNVVDSVTTSNSNLIASATAVKTANDNALTAQTAAAAAQATANAALPKAGGTMTGTLNAHDVNVQSGFAVQFAGGINGSLDGITDSTSTTDSTIAASATAVKAAYDLANASLPLTGGTMTGDITFQDAGEGVVFSDASSVDAVSDSVSTVSSTTVASSTAVKDAYDIGAAAIPCATITAVGDIVVGGAGPAPTALPVGTNGQVLVANSACATGLEWVTDVPGDVTGVNATFPITVDNTDPQQPTIGINGASTFAAGAVQLSDSVSSTSSLEASTPFATKTAYDLADAAVPCSSFTALGELLAGTGTGTYSALTVGTNGQFLAANSTCGTGLEWCTVSLACIPCSAYTAVGTILAGDGVGTYCSLPVGTAGQLLVPNAACAAGVEWVTCTAISLLGYTNSGAPRNTAFGGSAGDSITSGTDNTTIGFNAGTALTGGLNNTLVGSCAGDALTTGGNNTVLGVCALGASTTGSNNLAIGYAALGYGAAGSGNTAVGLGAGANISSGTNNTLIAQNAGDGITTGSNNVAMGFNALNTITTTSANVAIGSCSMCGATGGQNVAVGTNTLPITAGSNNVSIGHNTGCSNTAGSQNTLVGATAGASIVGTGSVTAVGFNAAGANAGVGSVAVGVDALGFGGAGSANTAVGQCAGRLLTGATNTLIGWSAGSAITTGSCNTVVGSFTGSTTLSCNVVLANGAGAVRFQSNQNGAWSPDGTNFGTIGQFLASNGTVAAPSWCTLSLACVPCAAFVACGDLLVGTGSATFTALPTGTDGQSLVVDTTCTATGGLKWGQSLVGYTCGSATFNTAYGCQAGDSVTTGTDNVTLGYNAGTAITTGSQNVVIGSGAAVSSNSVGVVTIGFCSGQALTTAGCVTHIGFISGRNSTGLNNTYVGALTGCAASNTSTCGTLLGFCAGSALTTGNGNNFIGFQAGRNVNTGGFNVAIGTAAFQTATTAANNVAVGCGALSSLSTSSGNTALGHRAMLNATTAANNVAVGCNAGEQLSTGSNNVLIGVCAGDTITTGTQNTFIGSASGGLAAGTSEGNTGLGFSALGGGVLAGAYNTAVGNNSGLSLTSGAINTLVGYSAGSAITTGGSNTLVGRYAGTAAMANNVVLSDGAGTIRFQSNASGAISLGTGGSYGTAGQILVSGGSGAAPTWSTSASVPANYGSFLRTTTQTNVGGATGQAAIFDTTVASNNFSVVGGTQITAAVAGTYTIVATYQVAKTDPGTDDINVWFKKNGTNVPNSAFNLTLVGNNAAQLATTPWIITLAAGDQIEAWWYSADANAILLGEPAAAPYPAIPSVNLVIMPVGA
jgi:hypothetical protein